ncbi:UBP-type zinc finger domain-containing protein [Chryseolinea sp. T2]|uniref:UBP-type zinc finger domain-containing protein n=1 Tax=Chryseolinea sp. T2 TaxID=3129255 RepID=UPI00307804EE
MEFKGEACQHIVSLNTLLQPKAHQCEECVKTKSRWVHLRTCQTCGVTLCCDSSPNKHATKHFHETGHPVIMSAEKGEYWLWCYPDENFVEY